MTTYTKTITTEGFITKLGIQDEVRTYVLDESTNEWKLLTSDEFVKIVKGENQMMEFEISCNGIEDEEKLYLKETAYVVFTSGSSLISKGRIQKIEYSTNYDCKASGYSVDILLAESQFSSTTRKVGDDTKRCEWVDVSSQTIAKELLSSDGSGSAPYIIDPATTGIFSGVPGDHPTASLRVEYGNRLNALAKLADIINYKWWLTFDTVSYDWDTVKFNMNSYISTSTTYTFNIGGDNQNCISTSKEIDKQNLVNDITILGYGDGLNQISASAEHATSISTYGRKAYTITDRSIRKQDAAQDIADKYLADHKDPIVRITINPCDPASVLQSVNVGDIVIVNDDESGSTGSHIVNTITCTSEYGSLSLELQVSNKRLGLMEYMEKQEKESENISKYMQGATNIYQVGYAENADSTHYYNLRFYMPYDAVAVNKVNLNFKLDNFRAYEQATDINSDSQTVVSSQQTSDAVSITSSWQNISNVNITSNCQLVAVKVFVTENSSALTRWYARLRVGSDYYPNSDGVQIGVSPSFDTEYAGIGGVHQHKVTGDTSSGGGHSHTSGSYDVTGDTASGGSPAHTHGLGPAGISGSSGSVIAHSHSMDFWSSSAIGGDHYHNLKGGCYAGTLFIPKNMTGQTIYLQLKHNDSGYTHSSFVRVHFEAHARHTHNMTYGIYEETLISPSVDLYAGDDGSETFFGTYTTNQSNLDITNNIGSSEGWKNIQFRPNKRMRLDCSAYVKLFIESR